MPKEKLSRTKVHTRYKLQSGQQVPGVTTVLGILAKPALIHWAWDLGTQGIDYKKYRDATADIGTLAHYLIACDLEGKTPDTTAFSTEQIDRAENALISYYEWRKGRTIKVILIEAPLVSEMYKYGGTIDCLAKVDGVLTLIDIKTSKAIYNEMIFQLAAYQQLLVEHGHTPQNVRILRVGRDESEGFEERVVADLSSQWEVFWHCLQVYSLQKQIRKVG